jgi:hypothetical protein
MKYIKMFEEYNWEDRRDEILDKISASGISSITDDEKRFLDSIKDDEQEKVHNELNYKGNNQIYNDSSGLFSFKHIQTIVTDDYVSYEGILYTPDIKYEGELIKGELSGDIVIYSDGEVSPDFFKKVDNIIIDLFEFTDGYENELENFINEIVSYLKTGKEI